MSRQLQMNTVLTLANAVAGFVRLGRALCEARSCRTEEAAMGCSAGAAKGSKGSVSQPCGGLWVAAKNPPVILQHPSCETM